ncbi:MAG: hypothetical protein ACE1ZA_21610, partial [Pseudomonadales bacterium]
SWATWFIAPQEPHRTTLAGASAAAVSGVFGGLVACSHLVSVATCAVRLCYLIGHVSIPRDDVLAPTCKSGP